MGKNLVCGAPYLRNHTSYDCHFWYRSVKQYILAYFSFFQNFDLSGYFGKRAKIAQNDKILSLKCHNFNTHH